MDKTQADHLHNAQWSARWALQALVEAMQFKPGKYPDPEVPIAQWQLAHAHLTAARDLLGPTCVCGPECAEIDCEVHGADCRCGRKIGLHPVGEIHRIGDEWVMEGCRAVGD